MVMVPPDAALRMRAESEAHLLQPARPVREVPSDLPELAPGNRFTARIHEELPGNLYKALVAGRLLTLQLPEGAKDGDVLELVVTDRSSKTLIAQRVQGAELLTDNLPVSEEAASYPHTSLSSAARAIGQLLTREGEKPTPALLNRGEPLLPQPPTGEKAAQNLAPSLAKAATESGLFYEAHQSQWVAGQRPVETLLREPQGQQALPLSSDGTSSVPEPLRALVQQQLDSIATQHLAWRGEVWPGQTMQWEIKQEDHEKRGAESEALDHWSTTVRLSLPRLGGMDATFHIAKNDVRLTIMAHSTDTTDDLRNAVPHLSTAMEAAGLRLSECNVTHAS
ncbi:MAG: flagellar hook-length control protein FliK [Rhodocyclaceae bacterium]|nr:flagellar hook-length control protein FliK [Rhodocyclaceae bacterium]